ncbi:MAG TPA: MFS transporter [Reyranellaceae bacterium]|nr:MFS transporter [Reyranellaceae bacterium]
MSSTSEATNWRHDAKVIALISTAHFVSHFHLMLLPPIFGPVREAFGVSYIEIGVALTVYNIVSAVLQTPAGFVVDRVGPRAMLIGGLLLSAGALVVAALLPGYWLFVVAYALLGLANTVYHPADYAILGAAINSKRIGKAFSIHNFAGFFGSAVAPAVVLATAALWTWKGAFLVAAVLAIVSALLLIVAGGVLPRQARPAAGEAGKSTSVGLDLLLSGPVVRNLIFFVCIGMANGGIHTYSVVALGELWSTPAAIANTALSGFLFFSAIGVLVGGIIADRTPYHERVAAVGFAFTSTMAMLMGWVDLPAALLIFVMSLGGLLNGIIQPSRDMMVRAVTPPGSFGKVFGFVSTGFNIGGMVAPLLYGWLMDRGQPRLIFLVVTLFIFAALFTAITRRKPQEIRHGLAD